MLSEKTTNATRGPEKTTPPEQCRAGSARCEEAGPVPGPYLSSTSGSNFRVDSERLFLANCTLTFEVTIFESFEIAYILGPLMSCIP